MKKLKLMISCCALWGSVQMGNAQIIYSDAVLVSTFAQQQNNNASTVNDPGSVVNEFQPTRLTVDKLGNVYFLNGTDKPTLRKISSTGIVSDLMAVSYFNKNANGTFLGGLAIDIVGNIYFADYSNNVIRKISPTGVSTVLAGSGVAIYADGTGISASFNRPSGVAVDAMGNVYVSDSQNHRIRKITPTGVVTTLAGSGVANYADGTGTGASFNEPYSLAVDAVGNVYVCDSKNYRIRKISPTGGVSTLAGSGYSQTENYPDGLGTSAVFGRPNDITIDVAGNLYVADDGWSSRIRKINPAGMVTTLAGSRYINIDRGTDGTGNVALFYFPSGVAVGPAGTVYAVDRYNYKIRKITPMTTCTWNGASWSPAAPTGNNVAVLNGSYNTATNGVFTAYGVTVNSGYTLRVAPSTTLSLPWNLVNNGTIIKCGTLTVTGTTTGNAIITAPSSASYYLSAGTNVCAFQKGVGYSVTSNANSTYAWSVPANASIASGAGSNAVTVNFNGTASGNYSLTATETNVCGTTYSPVAFNMYVQAAPTLAITPSATTVCAGTATNLAATTGFSTYLWSTGATTANITASPTANTTYTVTAKLAGAVNGCNENTTTRTITVNPKPNVTISAQTPACGYPPTTFTAYGATNYLWNNGGNTSGLTLSSTTGNSIVATPGNYFSYTVNVVGTDGNGCSNTASKDMGPGALGTPSLNYIYNDNANTPIMYGITVDGTPSNSWRSSIFEWNRTTNVYTKKIEIPGTENGVYSGEELRYYNGKYYGVSYSGGTNNLGTIFEWNPTTNIITTKIAFAGASNGEAPSGALSLVNGKFYGMTVSGGSNNLGTIFEWNPITNVLTSTPFTSSMNTGRPWGNIRVYNGLCYGVTDNGGASGMGTLFQYNMTTKVISILTSYSDASGGSPSSTPIFYNGKFYGFTNSVSGIGYLYEWNPTTLIFTKKVSLNAQTSYGTLTLYNNKLYGYTVDGGTYSSGSIFEWDPITSVLITKINFDGNNGSYPERSLTFSGGKFYGIASGVIFEWNPINNILTKKQTTGAFGNLIEAYSNDFICSNDGINRTYSVYTAGFGTGGTSYWTLPTGASIVSGAGSSQVTVNFGASTASGNISVYTVNGCGTSNTVTYPVVVTNCNQNSIANPRMAEEAEVSRTPATPLANFNVYPNPNNGLFNVSSDNQEATNVLVIDMMGNEVYKTQLEPNSTLQVDLSGKAKGIYHLKIEGTKQSKLINVQ